jgi:hypothetical protein
MRRVASVSKVLVVVSCQFPGGFLAHLLGRRLHRDQAADGGVLALDHAAQVQCGRVCPYRAGAT